ncbi:MAG: ABC transporter ATP-binding protein [Alphaproteobacteria bacterium]|nr:ABC transporter ATP-binding protein [Alphaproteobacteria bacterium]
MLEFKDVQTFYGSIQALKGISLTVEKGEIVTLIGANGAGKTTLLMTLSGITPASVGTITYKGEDITKMRTDMIVRKGIAHSPEGRRIFSKMTVFENLQMGAMTNDPSKFDDNLKYVYELFPRLKEREWQNGGTLSGGEQQMLAMGRALMSNPEFLLLDEPSLGLAPLVIKDIFRAIKQINEEHGTTVLLVEQNANHALKLAHRAYVLVTGNIVLSGTGQELLTNPEVQAAYLEGGH